MLLKSLAFLFIAATCSCFAAEDSDTKLTFDRFTKMWSIEYHSPVVVKEGMGPKLYNYGLIRFTSFMVISGVTPPSAPVVSVAFSAHHAIPSWKDSDGTIRILLDGKVTKREVIVKSNVQDEGKITLETGMVLFDAASVIEFLSAKECAVKIGTDEIDMSQEARKPLSAVVARFRAELAKGTFKDVLSLNVEAPPQSPASRKEDTQKRLLDRLKDVVKRYAK